MFKLLTERRFAPFFFTMGAGALNDNLFKSALVILIAYNMPREKADFLIQLSAGLFILPFFIFSGISGQICDKYEKSKLVVLIKLLEVAIMALGAWAFYINNIPLLMGILFLMGAQSTLFGPVKYSILPQHLKANELLGGNGLISMGTFLAILAGTMAGGFLVSKSVIESHGIFPISLGVLGMALVGALFGLLVPKALEANPDLKIKLNPFTETWRTIKLSKTNPDTFLSIMAISWFWYYGFFFMASLPSYCRDALAGDEKVASILLTAISVGMGLGSILCNRLSKGHLRLGLVVVGAFGLSFFGADIYATGVTHEGLAQGQYLNLSEFFSNSKNWRPIFDLMGIGLFGGLYIVPLYTLLQERSPDKLRSQLIASNNILNAIFMVSAAVTAIVLFAIGLNILQIFLAIALLNSLVAIFLLVRLPEHFYIIFFSWVMRLLYPRFSIKGEQNLPKDGPVLVVSNHVSFIDPLLICRAMNRPPRFVMDQSYYDMKILKWFFTSSKSIPITPKKIDPTKLEQAMEDIIEGLNKGHLITIFPEGFITKDGEMIPFKDGVERIATRVSGLQVVPLAIKGMWGSWFSRAKGKALKGLPPNRMLPKIEIEVGQVLIGDAIKASSLQESIRQMRGDWR